MSAYLSYYGCLKALILIVGGNSEDIDADLAERMSAMKRPGESDMDFYERRYQERVGIIIYTLEAQSKLIVADQIQNVAFYYFSEKIRLAISCESFTKQTIHMK